MNKLSSMCYPRYKPDSLNFAGKLRALPPVTKLRVGELYGSANNEVLGHLKQLTYTFPDNAAWETEQGKRVPKEIDVTMGYQIMHEQTPNQLTQFFGQNISTNISHVPIDEQGIEPGAPEGQIVQEEGWMTA